MSICTDSTRTLSAATGQKVYPNKHQRKWSFERLFMTKVRIADSGCWLWTASQVSPRVRYGQIIVPVGGGIRKKWLAHRLAYSHLVGPIPDGLQLDHLCGQSLCVNPKHLEPVSAFENTRRALLSKRGISHWVNTETNARSGINMNRLRAEIERLHERVNQVGGRIYRSDIVLLREAYLMLVECESALKSADTTAVQS